MGPKTNGSCFRQADDSRSAFFFLIYYYYFCKERTTENYLVIGNETNNLIDLKKKILGNLCTLIKTLILKSKQFDVEFSFQEKKKNERKEIKRDEYV